MFAGDVLVMALADLLFELFCDEIDGGVKVILDILREKVRAGQRKTDGTGELSLRSFGLIMFEGDSSIHSIAVQMSQLVNSADDMIFDGFSESEIMRRKDQFHGDTMQCGYEKIQ